MVFAPNAEHCAQRGEASFVIDAKHRQFLIVYFLSPDSSFLHSLLKVDEVHLCR